MQEGTTAQEEPARLSILWPNYSQGGDINEWREWFKTERGIEPETLAAFNVEKIGDWITFPYPEGKKLRKQDGEIRRFISEGNMPDIYPAPNESPSKVAFLVEGETDTMRLWQALRIVPVASQGHVFGLSGIETWEPRFAEKFSTYDKVYVILDNDKDYNVQGRVDTAWKHIRLSIGGKAKRITLPLGVKDLCEFFQTYSIENLGELCKRKPVPISKLKRLDLNKEPPEMDWLVEGMICKGDVNLMIGQPSLGKSWLMMDLALAVASGRETWLDMPVKHKGKVMYIDEENPEDIIYHRFRKLGLTGESARNIYYLYRPGIWINKEPEALLEEAIEIEPEIVVIDSLSRVHSEDENNANAMAKLFREAIVPIARETGAAVVVIHHTIKSETDNSFQRARGSGDITAVVDAAIDVRGSTIPHQLLLSQYKSRRSVGGKVISVQITDEDDNRVALRTQQEHLPF